MIHVALPHVEFLEAVVEHREQSFVAYESPAFGVVETGRGLAGEAFDNDVGAQAAENLDEEVDVLLDAPEPEPLGRGVIFGGKRRAAEELQLVELYGRQGQAVYLVRAVDEHPGSARRASRE